MNNNNGQKLAGKVAVVTGGSRGIGAAITTRLAADGASVAFTYTKAADAAASVVKEIERRGGKRAERVKNMRAALDKEKFGPWALVTGASSGIGKEFARQIAASGINVVLVARRDALLAELGRAISQEFGVQYRALAMDLSQEGFIAGLADATHDIDIGLVVSNAGTANPGEFLKLDRELLQATLRLSTMAHLDITHHFGAKLAKRRRGGIVLAGAMGAENGVPLMATDGAAKAY